MYTISPKRLTAIQFAVFAFTASKVIPQSDDILLPMVWLMDKKVAFAYLAYKFADTLLAIPRAILIIPTFFSAPYIPWPWRLYPNHTTNSYGNVVSFLVNANSWELIIVLVLFQLFAFFVSAPTILTIAAYPLRKRIKKTNKDLYYRYFLTKKEEKKMKEQMIPITTG